MLSSADRGAGSTNTGGESTLVVTPASNFTAGSLAVLCIAYDNSGTNGADAYSSITDSHGNTWTARANELRDPGAANEGCVCRLFTSDQAIGTLTTGSTITVTFSATTVARAWALHEVSASNGTPVYANVLSSAAGASGSSTTPSMSVGTPLITNSVIIGATAIEAGTTQAITPDSDTTDGSWTTQQTSQVGTTTAGMCISSQRKHIGTGPSAQTYDLSLSITGDWANTAIYVFEKLADVTDRYYFSSTGVPSDSPGFDAGWSRTTEAVRRTMSTTKDGSAMTDFTCWAGGSAADNEAALAVQFSSLELPVGTIIHTGTTLKGQIRVKESGTDDNLTQIPSRLAVYNGTTLQATPKSLSRYGSANEFDTTLENREIYDGDLSTAVYKSVSGDRFVLEVGGHCNGGGTTVTGTLSVGSDSGSDLPEDETTQTALNPWFEITYQTYDDGTGGGGTNRRRRILLGA